MKRLNILIFSFLNILILGCVDTVIMPEDRTVEEDFWKTKTDVQMMVSGLYQSLASSAVVSDLIVWGGLRSDELVPTSVPGNTPLDEINKMFMQPTNSYSNWDNIYSIINSCNVILEKAGAVTAIDPAYYDSDYLTDRSQVLAIRSLCYFYLVRTFRDVAFSEVATMNSSQDLELGQTAPATVIDRIIADLQEAEQNALPADIYSDWRRVGLINRDGIRALLADVLLWRAAVTHSSADYQQAAAYGQQVIDSKIAQHRSGPVSSGTSVYPLAAASAAFSDLFVTQNAEESIFELQLDGTNNVGTGICQMYYKYDGESPSGYVKASQLFRTYGHTGDVYHSRNDYRFWENCYGVTGNDESFHIRKMTADRASTIRPASAVRGIERTEDRASGSYRQNWIFYRLSDVMLMRAEALVELATGNDDPLLQEAFALVREINTRSLANNNDILKVEDFATKNSMEQLVMAERMRELCFEGKRWFDLLRYNYRHSEGVDYTTILADQQAQGRPQAGVYEGMVNILLRKYTGETAIGSLIKQEGHLYMPIPQADVEVNPNLKQNPAYGSDDEFKKNI